MTDNLNEAVAAPKQQFPMNHGFLLSLVIGLGILIVLGAVALGFAMMQRGATKSPKTSPVARTAPTVPQTAVTTANFGDHEIAVPAGFKLENFHANGDRLLLRLSNVAGDTAIWLIDMASGQSIGRYYLKIAE